MTVLDAKAANPAADLAAENAELRRRLDAVLAREQATAEILAVINSSQGDLAPVFDAILDQALRLCGGAFGVFAVYEGEHYRIVASRALPPGLAEFVKAPVRVEPGSMPDRLRAGEDTVQIADIAAIEPARRTPGLVAMIDLGQARAALWVGLRKEAVTQGFIGVYRQEARPFTETQIALLQNFAAQAVIAMENARLITKTREALEQQTATAEVLQVINSSPGDLAPVFETMLKKATTLCDASLGTLWTYDGEVMHLAANRGASPEYAAYMAREPLRPGAGALGSLVHGEALLHVIDLKDTDAYRNGDRHRRALVDLGGARTLLGIPLRIDDSLLGAFLIYRREPQPFTEQQITLLQNFAAQAVIAMENARLITETREALEQQTATAEVLGVINSSPGDLAPVFDAILEKARTLCDAAFGTLMVRDGAIFRAAALHDVPRRFAEVLTHGFEPRPASPIGRLVGGEPLIHLSDLSELALEVPDDPVPHAAVDLGGVRTLLMVPLRSGDDLLGVIPVFRQEVRPFTDKQIALLQNFAAQAVIAIENARLLGELRQRTDEVAELNRGLEVRVAEQVEELGRVGKLKRFLAPQLAELIVSQGDENILESHRREIVVVFCDLRGFTAFAETAEPEEVLDLLREYHAALGPLVGEFEGTLDHFSGDGIMVFFNDPVPCPDPAERAVKMAVAMRAAAAELIAAWRRRGRELGFGVGIAQGYATLGQIGFADRSDYTAIGTVCNLASRLCGEAKDGQILLSRRVAGAVEETIALEEIGTLSLKGLAQPVAAFNVLAAGAAS